MKTIIKRHSINICPLCADSVFAPLRSTQRGAAHRQRPRQRQSERERQFQKCSPHHRCSATCWNAVQRVWDWESGRERNWCCATVGDINYNCKQRERQLSQMDSINKTQEEEEAVQAEDATKLQLQLIVGGQWPKKNKIENCTQQTD